MQRSLALILLLCALSGPAMAADPATLGAHDPPRVKAAREEKAADIKALFQEHGLEYPAKALLLRTFKDERALELWAAPPAQPFQRLKTYRICAKSGGPGPKRREGDGQVPEGFYTVSGFNPSSNFLLSLRVSYPNQADRIRNKGRRLGGDIFIHGACVTIGCIPIEDDGIQELFVIAQDAHKAGATIAVHTFPARMDRPELSAWADSDPQLTAFWENLAEGYRWFELKKTLPRIQVGKDGRYLFSLSGRRSE